MQSITDALRQFFVDPRRQLFAWIGLAALGALFAALGIWLALAGSGNGDSTPASPETPTTTPATRASPTPNRTRTATPTPTRSPTPTVTPSPTVTSGGGGGGTSNPGTSGGTSGDPPATPTPTSVPSTNLAYCNTISATAPPTRVAGFLNVDDPSSADVYLAFDGARGPTATITSENQGGTVVYGYYADFATGGADCANKVGAALTVVVDGVSYPSGFTVGDANPGFIRVDVP